MGDTAPRSSNSSVAAKAAESWENFSSRRSIAWREWTSLAARSGPDAGGGQSQNATTASSKQSTSGVAGASSSTMRPDYEQEFDSSTRLTSHPSCLDFSCLEFSG